MRSYHTLLIQLSRIISHSMIIMGGFFCMIQLREMTDLIPWIQLRIPLINTTETMIYALIATVLFVLIAFQWHLYRLYKPPQDYTKHFFYTYLLWGASITAIAYYGYGFVFSDGISRLVILWTMIWSLFLMLLIDGILNNLLYAYFTTKPIQIAIIYQYVKDYDTFCDQFSSETLYQLT